MKKETSKITRRPKPTQKPQRPERTDRRKKAVWFVRKSYGWGYNPVSKEGWAVVAIHVALLLLWADLFLRGKTESPSAVALFMGLIILQTGILILIAHKTCED